MPFFSTEQHKALGYLIRFIASCFLSVMFLFTHVDRQGVDMSVTVCLFVRLRIFPLRIKLVASYFVRRFIGVQGRESHILWTSLPRKPQIGWTGQRTGHAHPHVNIAVVMRRRTRHARDVPFIKRAWCRCGRRIGMCGYTSVRKDGRNSINAICCCNCCLQVLVCSFSSALFL